jgi:hypothetical protein
VTSEYAVVMMDYEATVMDREVVAIDCEVVEKVSLNGSFALERYPLALPLLP